VLSAEQFFWRLMDEYCRYWEMQFRLLHEQWNGGAYPAPTRRREPDSPKYMRLIVDNTGLCLPPRSTARGRS